jgi:hypothetical protein
MVETLTGQNGKWGIQQLSHAFSTCLRSYYHGHMSYNIDNLHWLPVPGSRVWECCVLSLANQTLLTFQKQKRTSEKEGRRALQGLI